VVICDGNSYSVASFIFSHWIQGVGFSVFEPNYVCKLVRFPSPCHSKTTRLLKP
jgi:hypothetical protein